MLLEAFVCIQSRKGIGSSGFFLLSALNIQTIQWSASFVCQLKDIKMEVYSHRADPASKPRYYFLLCEVLGYKK